MMLSLPQPFLPQETRACRAEPREGGVDRSCWISPSLKRSAGS